MLLRSFASAEFAMKKKQTRRKKFLAEIERVVPWGRLIGVIEPLYPTSGRVGRQPVGVSRMLRMYLLQQWYGLADEALEDAIYDSQALRDFVGIDLSWESVPDATTLLKVRRLLVAHELTKALCRRHQRAPRRTGPAVARGHDRRFDHHCGASFVTVPFSYRSDAGERKGERRLWYEP